MGNLLMRGLPLIVLGLMSVPAQAGMHELYGTREPRSCGPFTAIEGTAPTDAEAIEIYICDYERHPVGIAAKLFLLEDVAIEVGRGRPFGQTSDFSLGDADPSLEIFPIRGTATTVQCSEINDRNRGANCAEFPQTGEGVCYRNTFDEWSCVMALIDVGEWRSNVPPR